MTREEIFDTVQSLSKEKDLYAASEFVLGLADESGVAEIFGNLVLDCYWKAKSTEQMIHFANAGIHYCLAKACADDGIEDDSARELRFAAKRMATNAASFTWIGWEEPGVAISAEQMRQGLAFARYSVRQLHELEPTDAQLAFSYWFLAAHLIAEVSYEEALSVFVDAREYNSSDGGNPDYDYQTMLEGYIGMAVVGDENWLSGVNDHDAPRESHKGTKTEPFRLIGSMNWKSRSIARIRLSAAFYAKQLYS